MIREDIGIVDLDFRLPISLELKGSPGIGNPDWLRVEMLLHGPQLEY